MARIGWLVGAALALATPAWAQAPKTLTLDASADLVYVALGEEARVVAVEEPAVSDAWDLSIAGTSLVLREGVTAHCICANANASSEELQAMSPETELADFTGVTAADIPADGDAWHPAAIAAAPWYRYNIAGQHLIWPTYNVYLIRNGDEVYKFQVIGYYGDDGTPRQLTFRYEKL